MTDFAVKVDAVSKNFILPHEKTNTAKGAFTGMFRKRSGKDEVQHALKNISFTIEKGEFFGIVGRNGSGKSTLLKIIAGIYQPTKGNVRLDGKLVPFIELGVGFNGELTGRENVYLNGALLGFSKKEMDKQYDAIVSFAELERFMDQKLKNYSSGMQVRLAFSLAIRAEADILLVDEVLAVGDASFQRKCFEHFRLLKKNHKTVVFVTHDMGAVREYCDRAILIEQSEIIDSGKAGEVATQYARLFNTSTSSQSGAALSKSKRWGDKRIIYGKVHLDNKLLVDNDQPLSFTAEVTAHEDMEEPILGFSITSQSGQQMLGTNSRIKRQPVGNLKKGDKVTLHWSLNNIFSDGVYYINVAATAQDGVTQCDWWDEAAQFEVINEERVPYPINMPIQLVVSR